MWISGVRNDGMDPSVFYCSMMCDQLRAICGSESRSARWKRRCGDWHQGMDIRRKLEPGTHFRLQTSHQNTITQGTSHKLYISLELKEHTRHVTCVPEGFHIELSEGEMLSKFMSGFESWQFLPNMFLKKDIWSGVRKFVLQIWLTVAWMISRNQFRNIIDANVPIFCCVKFPIC